MNPQPAFRSPWVTTTEPDSTLRVTLGPVFAPNDRRIAVVPRGSVPLSWHPLLPPPTDSKGTSKGTRFVPATVSRRARQHHAHRRRREGQSDGEGDPHAAHHSGRGPRMRSMRGRKTIRPPRPGRPAGTASARGDLHISIVGIEHVEDGHVPDRLFDQRTQALGVEAVGLGRHGVDGDRLAARSCAAPRSLCPDAGTSRGPDRTGTPSWGLPRRSSARGRHARVGRSAAPAGSARSGRHQRRAYSPAGGHRRSSAISGASPLSTSCRGSTIRSPLLARRRRGPEAA